MHGSDVNGGSTVPPSPHPLAAILRDAADGRFPAADGTVDVLPPDADGTRAIVAFTGHAVVLTDASAEDVAERAPDGGFGSSLAPDVQAWVAGSSHVPGTLDAVLVARGLGGGDAQPTRQHDGHPRVARARQHRRDVSVFADRHGVVVLGTGLVGRRELSVELFDPDSAPSGAGRRLLALGLEQVPAGEPVWAQVSPGNARSLRAFLAAGFVPVGSEVLIWPRIRLAPGVQRVSRFNVC
ncbi:N-acetyltransferase [Antiquaquibacter soli]|uniref:N-acetyltransferase n=1 Tax=Antiquaquibacter soli TaxID=3064523 RepID=A0ABT9BSD4_9MICO|nr:N-acetyltransferase [Protaetiibacter sp. WY-16]MDO7883539.1 N-acetyltransferase [Protaetiibacter sp. WY-16]